MAQQGFSKNEKPKEVLIFIDKSSSVNFNTLGVQAKSDKILREGINKVTQANDELELLVIHDKTIGASTVANYSIAPFTCKPGTPPLKVKQLQNFYRGNISKEKTVFYNQSVNLIKDGYDSQNKKWTDIIGVLEVLSRKASINKNKEIYLFTDGQQSSKEFTVDPKNRQEAINLANAHAKKINSSLFIDRSVLDKSVVHFVLPYVGTSTRFNNNLTYYWEQLFGQFGMVVDFI